MGNGSKSCPLLANFLPGQAYCPKNHHDHFPAARHSCDRVTCNTVRHLCISLHCARVACASDRSSFFPVLRFVQAVHFFQHQYLNNTPSNSIALYRCTFINITGTRFMSTMAHQCVFTAARDIILRQQKHYTNQHLYCITIFC
jgi:hypothetical protein